MRPCIFVIGTRAQLVKVAPVLRSATEAGLEHTVWFSGQHKESMSDLLEDFGVGSVLRMPEGASERATVAGLLRWLPRAARDCYRYVRETGARGYGAPLVVVHGDTLSTLVSALAGRLAGGDVVHLESGLTSKRLLDPFPEELLRRLTFRVTAYALCPNDASVRRMERYACKDVVDTGENTLLDSVRYALDRESGHDDASAEAYFVASIHRVQNIYDKSTLAGIVDELIAASEFAEVRFVLHPATKKRLAKTGLWNRLEAAKGVRLQARMPYTPFLSLLAHARGVFSDGGSNQEELSYLGVPTVLFRKRSERPDGLGRNVVLRDSIGELAAFIRAGRLDGLRQARRLDPELQPSRTAVAALLRWAGAETPRAAG